MEKIEESSRIYKPMMAGLFAGYFATIANLVYDLAFRNYVDFPLHELINVSTLIFATLFVLTIAGCLLALSEKLFKEKGSIIYMVLFALLTVYLVYGVFHVHRSADATVNHEFQYLLGGIIVLTGLFATFFTPYFRRHSDMFM